MRGLSNDCTKCLALSAVSCTIQYLVLFCVLIYIKISLEANKNWQ